MKQKPDLSFWKLWNLSFGFFGVQIAYALQSANISRIFATLGAHSHRAWHPVRYWTKIPTTFMQAVGTLFLPFLVLLSIRDSDPLGNQQFVCKSRIDDT